MEEAWILIGIVPFDEFCLFFSSSFFSRIAEKRPKSDITFLILPSGRYFIQKYFQILILNIKQRLVFYKILNEAPVFLRIKSHIFKSQTFFNLINILKGNKA